MDIIRQNTQLETGGCEEGVAAEEGTDDSDDVLADESTAVPTSPSDPETRFSFLLSFSTESDCCAVAVSVAVDTSSVLSAITNLLLVSGCGCRRGHSHVLSHASRTCDRSRALHCAYLCITPYRVYVCLSNANHNLTMCFCE